MTTNNRKPWIKPAIDNDRLIISVNNETSSILRSQVVPHVVRGGSVSNFGYQSTTSPTAFQDFFQGKQILTANKLKINLQLANGGGFPVIEYLIRVQNSTAFWDVLQTAHVWNALGEKNLDIDLPDTMGASNFWNAVGTVCWFWVFVRVPNNNGTALVRLNECMSLEVE